MSDPRPARIDIYMIGGSLSTGKTTLGDWAGATFGVDVMHVDDMVSSSDDADLRAACARFDPESLSVEELCEVLVAKGDALTPLLAEYVTARLREGRPAVIEGEGIQPDLALRWAQDPRVRCVFLIEESGQRLFETLCRRSTQDGTPRNELSPLLRKVSEMDAQYGTWLRCEAEARGMPWIASHPFETLAHRFLAAVS